MFALVFEAAFRSLALVLIVWLGLKVLRITNPHTRMATWRVVLMSTSAMPLLMHWKSVVLPTPPLTVPAFLPADFSLPTVTLTVQASPGAVPTILDWQAIAFGAYLLVAGLLALRLIVGVAQTWRLQRLATPVLEEWTDGHDVRVSSFVRVPVTFGSTIILPTDYTDWSVRKRVAVMSHEHSHIIQGDFFVLLLALLNRAVFWFSPGPWWLSRELTMLAEARSDAAAIEAMKDRVTYAEILLDITTKAHRIPTCVPMARLRTVNQRVQQILTETRLPSRMNPAKWLFVVTCVVLPAAITAGAIARVRSGDKAAVAPSETTVAQRRYEQARPRQEVPIDPKLLNDYVGHYQLSPFAIFSVTRDGTRLFAQLTGQPAIEIFPESDHDFFFKVIPAQITFVADETARAMRLVLRQNGYEKVARRIDEVEANAIAETLKRRIKEDLAVPGSKAALRRIIEEGRRGQPDYDQVDEKLAQAMRQQLPTAKRDLAMLGELRSVAFKAVGPDGSDIYDVRFAGGNTQWRIGLTPDGKISVLSYRHLS